MKRILASIVVSTGIMPIRNLATGSAKKLFLALLVAGTVPLANAAVINQQPGGAIDPVGGGEMDTEATGSVLLSDFNSVSSKVIQANWTGVNGTTGNTINGDDVDVRIDHSPAFSAGVNSSAFYNSSSVGNGYQWTGTNGQQLTISFGTYSGSFTADRTVAAAGLMLMNFGGAYPNVTITYYDSTNGVLSTQNFSGGADSEGSGGADFFTGYTNSQDVIASITIDITRTTGNTSGIALDALTYATAPPPPQLVTLDPADNSIGVASNANLVATFDKDIQAGTGSISINRTSDDSLVESFDVTSSPQLTFIGAQLTIIPTSDLPADEYYVLIPAGAVEDLSGIAFAGTINAGDWSFSVGLRNIDLVWEPDASAVWNTIDVNWDTNSDTVADTAFMQGDRVFFTDSGLAQPTVELALPLTPLSVTVSNTAGTYQLGSSSGGYIGGSGSLVKQGAGALYLLTDNDYAGSTLISGGTLQVGNNGGTGTLGTGTITNDATLRFNRTNDLTVEAIAGTGALYQDGSGVLTLAGANTMSGVVTISSGTLALSNTVPLTSVSGITIADGATLRADVVNAAVDAPITLGGISTTSTITAPIEPLTSGATTGPQLFTLNGPISGDGNVIFKGLNPFNWTGTIELGAQSTYSGSTLLTTDDSMAEQFNPIGTNNQNIDIRLGIDNALPTTTVVTLDGRDGVGSGRYCQIFLAGKNQTLAGLKSIPRTSRFQRVINPTGATPCTLTVSNTVDCVFSGNLGGTGGSGLGGSNPGNNFSLVKNGSGTFTLDRSVGCNYANGTTINGGTLITANTTGSATGAGDVTVNNGGTLAGTGRVSGNVTMNSGGTLSPGTSIGTLTLGGTVVLNAGSTSTFEVDGTSLQNDEVLLLSSTITYGGVLNVVPSGTFSEGQTFTLFSGGAVPGNFSSITGSPGSGLAFTFTNGVLSVVADPTPAPATLTNIVSGGALNLSWPDEGWILEWQTNLLSAPWLPLTDGSVSSTNIPIDITQPSVFYRLAFP